MEKERYTYLENKREKKYYEKANKSIKNNLLYFILSIIVSWFIFLIAKGM